jgi:hypothetical protein
VSGTTRRESAGEFQRAGTILRRSHGDPIVSRRKLRQADVIELVRDRRETANQTLGFASRPFVLCGLPVGKPKRGEFLHERRNGRFLLQVTGHPGYGLPWGQDRLVPIFLATLAVRRQCQTIRFRSGAEMLYTFGMQQGGTQYRRLIASFQRIFGATIFFGTDTQRDKGLLTRTDPDSPPAAGVIMSYLPSVCGQRVAPSRWVNLSEHKW